MDSPRSFPDQIADRAAEATHDAETRDAVRRAVLAAFGCSCAAPAGAGRCPVHGGDRREDEGEPVLTSRADSWEDDPYFDFTKLERRDGVQDNLRGATEFTRALRTDLAAALRRGRPAEDHLEQAVGHADFNGGLTAGELDAAETALAALGYSLDLLYYASNHVGDRRPT
ncbi:hypothetical protein [Actinoplanes couchii]|uniref:Uncharacterized protein n=1 Tax=Actinoplanes couchii TaxID=403638 RepID=A0ABQ3X1Y5_9ACTN|nr:hypothetical protein [Actinoplanes couchii]MDR6316927.1 hypothetical protein [Actinoplanes couchii]GID52534.1 hypothetical protein Aco03nite_009380 [Actinoplanes couchii]